jgi:hypothetical protein
MRSCLTSQLQKLSGALRRQLEIPKAPGVAVLPLDFDRGKTETAIKPFGSGKGMKPDTSCVPQVDTSG